MAPTLMSCPACGHAVSQLAQACPSCGNPISPAPRHSRIVAALLALFLGGFGLHKFYLGRGVQGLIYLLFCWTFIPAVIALFEAIGYLMSSDEAFRRNYG